MIRDTFWDFFPVLFLKNPSIPWPTRALSVSFLCLYQINPTLLDSVIHEPDQSDYFSLENLNWKTQAGGHVLVVTRASRSCGWEAVTAINSHVCAEFTQRASLQGEPGQGRGNRKLRARECAAPEQLHNPKAFSVSKSNSRRGSTVLPVLNSVRSFCTINLLLREVARVRLCSLQPNEP